jgi:hypothetical protein
MLPFDEKVVYYTYGETMNDLLKQYFGFAFSGYMRISSLVSSLFLNNKMGIGRVMTTLAAFRYHKLVLPLNALHREDINIDIHVSKMLLKTPPEQGDDFTLGHRTFHHLFSETVHDEKQHLPYFYHFLANIHFSRRLTSPVLNT